MAVSGCEAGIPEDPQPSMTRYGRIESLSLSGEKGIPHQRLVPVAKVLTLISILG